MRKNKRLAVNTPSLFDLASGTAPEEALPAAPEQPGVLSPLSTEEDESAPFLVYEPPAGAIIRTRPASSSTRSTDLLASLNAPQREAVTTTEGPLLILAGPGSGKTRVITTRMAYLALQLRVPPSALLAVTFTNRAAWEMRSRLQDLVGVSAAGQMVLGTFHAIAARMLRRAPLAFLAEYGLTRAFTIADEDDALRVMREAARRMQQELEALGENEDERTPGALLEMVSQAKNHMVGPERMAQDATSYREATLAALYRSYQQLLRIANRVDFDDLLLLAERLLRREEGVRARYQQRWHYLHVDEYQDCNLPQYCIVRLLAQGSEERHEGLGNVCVVGDDDQMIYTWRGASAENIQRFQADFPQARTILLEQNYRSTQAILDGALGIVQRVRDRQPKNLWTERGEGDPIPLVTCRDDEAEGRFIAQEILRLHAAGEAWQACAVLYRTNAQSRAIEEALLASAVPYTVLGSKSFYERKEVKDVIAYLRLLNNPKDDLSAERIINVPPRKIGAKTVAALKTWAGQQGRSLLESAARAADASFLSRAAREALVAFARLVESLRREMERLPLSDLTLRVLAQSGYEAYLKGGSQEDQERWANLLELLRIAATYDGLPPHEALSAFLEYLALVGGSDVAQTGKRGVPGQADESQDCVTLLTLHAAKGLEFPIVFITGMDEGSLPHARSFDDPERLDEERRLAYVGVTRTMRRLYLVRAKRRSLFGRTVATSPSRFLDDLPEQTVLA